MSRNRIPIATLAALVPILLCGCSSEGERTSGEHSSEASGEHAHEHDGEHAGEHAGENATGHDRDGGEHGDGAEGEESGTEIAKDATYDEVRHGARLILAYDAEKNAFLGTVENTTAEPLERVRVEVHLSNGKELGPTEPTDLGPGEKVDVALPATKEGFERWNAHPEVGSGEHAHDGEGGEHR